MQYSKLIALCVLAFPLSNSSLAFALGSGSAPVAVNDNYATTTGNNLSVDAPGVLTNDSDAEGDSLTAVLVSSAGASGVLLLFSDGSLEYEVAPGFVGTDTFTYAANDGSSNSAPATVTFTVSSGGGTGQAIYTDRATFLAAVAAQGWSTTNESFEDPLWPRTPTTAASVSNLGLTWTGNHPGNGLTTGSGPAVEGQFGFFELPHGNYTTGMNCNTPGNCTDGWIVSADAAQFVAAGMWIDCNAGTAGIQFLLDGDFANPVDFGAQAILPAGSLRFFGVIDTAGFTSLEVHDTEGKAEDAAFIFGDLFSFVTEPVPTVTAYGSGINPVDSLTVVSGAPQLGTILTLGIDNPLGTQSIGSRAFLSIALAPDPAFPAGQSLPNLGMAGPGAPGEYLLSLTPPNPVFNRLGPAWMGAGNPATLSLGIPADPTLSGISIYAQGALLDLFPNAAIPIGLTSALQLQLAP